MILRTSFIMLATSFILLATASTILGTSCIKLATEFLNLVTATKKNKIRLVEKLDGFFIYIIAINSNFKFIKKNSSSFSQTLFY